MAAPADTRTRMFSYRGTCFVAITDLLRWLDVQLRDESLSAVKRSAYAWIQANFDALRHSKADDVRTMRRDGEGFASTADLKTWLGRHVQVTAEEWQCVEWTWRQISMIEDAQGDLDAKNYIAKPEHVQIHDELMTEEMIEKCCALGTMLHLKNGELTASYIHGDISIPVIGRNVRGAMRNIAGRLAADPTAPHHAAAQHELGLRPRNPRLPLNQLVTTK